MKQYFAILRVTTPNHTERQVLRPVFKSRKSLLTTLKAQWRALSGEFKKNCPSYDTFYGLEIFRIENGIITQEFQRARAGGSMILWTLKDYHTDHARVIRTRTWSAKDC